MSTERDTHFLEAAKHFYDDLEPLFRNLFYAEDDGRVKEAQEQKEFIQTFMTQDHYDLVQATLHRHRGYVKIPLDYS